MLRYLGLSAVNDHEKGLEKEAHLVRPGIRGSRPRYSPTLFGDRPPSRPFRRAAAAFASVVVGPMIAPRSTDYTSLTDIKVPEGPLKIYELA